MHPREIIDISDDDDDKMSVVEIVQSSAPVMRTSLNPPVTNNTADSCGYGSDEDHDYNMLMQELSEVIDSFNSNLPDQSPCLSTLDSYIVPEITEESVVESNQSNAIKILSVKSLNQRINQWIDGGESQLTPQAHYHDQQPLGEDLNSVTGVDMHVSQKKEFIEPNQFLELKYGNSKSSVPNDPWARIPMNKLELKILNKYFPTVKLTRVSLSGNKTNNDTKDAKSQVLIDNADDRRDVKPLLHQNMVTVKQEVDTLSQETKDIKGFSEISCGVCVQTFYSRESFEEHVKNSHTVKKTFTCKDCDFVFDDYFSMQTHRWTHTELRPLRCPHCPYGSKKRQSLNNHIRRIHTTYRPYACITCTYTTTSSQELKNHSRRIHKNDLPYECSTCQYATASVRDLKKHIKNTHPMNNNNQCNTCGFVTISKRRLKNHRCQKNNYSEQIKIKIKDKILPNEREVEIPKCDVCPSRCVDRSKHIQRHHSLFPYNQIATCQFCTETFTNKYNMRLHSKIHVDKNFRKCPECLYTTFSVKQFEKHRQDHLFKRFFICNNCSKAFDSKKNLKHHLLTFHENNNF